MKAKIKLAKKSENKTVKATVKTRAKAKPEPTGDDLLHRLGARWINGESVTVLAKETDGITPRKLLNTLKRLGYEATWYKRKAKKS